MMCSSSGSYEKKTKTKNNERIGGIVRLIKGASLDGTKTTNKKKRASDGIDALRATASLLVSLFDEDEDDDRDTSIIEEMRNACDELVRRVREDAEYFSDGDRIVFDWALRVIESNIASSSGETTATSERRGDATITVDEFPFRYVTPNISNVLKNITVEDLRKEVPFKAEKLITRTGKRVDERRETCFVAESGIGGLAYSGKIMEPTLLNEASLPLVTTIRTAIVEALKNDEDYAGCDIDFDCALMNLYPDGSSACAWHTDPEMGTVWDRDSVIVSIGETRRFAFRKLAGGGDKTQNDGEEEQVWVRVHHGDCILMRDDCNDNWEHCVFGKENDSNNAARISLVFKKALSRGGGRKKGHGTNSKEKKKAK
jgi:alkylated DNA repair dioxygenase AlkB